jgi:hypothetical protein
MFRKYILPTLLVTLIASCSHKPDFIIDGRVPDSSFEGSRIYLVALDAPITRNVDSTIVSGGKFSFRMTSDSTIAKIIRLPLKYNNMTEDLVVITEPGTMQATIATISFGGGTSLNDKLQSWKEIKTRNDSLQGVLFAGRDLQKLPQKSVDSLISVANGIRDSFMPQIKSLISENTGNGIGLLLFKVYYNMLPADFRKEIDTKTSGKLYKKDAQLKKMRIKD